MPKGFRSGLLNLAPAFHDVPKCLTQMRRASAIRLASGVSFTSPLMASVPLLSEEPLSAAECLFEGKPLSTKKPSTLLPHVGLWSLPIQIGGRSWLEERWPKLSLKLPSRQDSGFSLFVQFAGGPGTQATE